MKTKDRTITATEFKARCLKMLDGLEAQGIVVTKRGRPIAKVTPVCSTDITRFYGSMKEKIVIKGDLFSTGAKWRAEP